MANLKSLLIETALESYRKELEDYLRSKGSGESNGEFDFPYLPGHTVTIEKNYMGDFGYAVKVTVFDGSGNQKAAARVMEGGAAYLDANDRKISEAPTVPNPAGLFGRLVEIV